MEDIEKCMRTCLDEHEAIKEPEKSFTYCFIFKAANNSSLSREAVFKMAGAYIQSKCSSSKVDFDNPDYVLYIQIICNICYISFLRNFHNYRKYNLVEMGA